jgi:hypothetical protein
MKMLKLKNGAEEAEPAVRVVMAALSNLIDRYPTAFYDVVMMCRPGNYKPFGNNGQILQDLALVSHDGTVHDSIRNVILSAVSGDGLAMALGNPLAA